MSKKITIYALIVITLLGSLIATLSVNMFFNDVVNLGAGLTNGTILVSIPADTITCMLAIMALYVIRLYKRPGTFKKLTSTYLIIIAALGAIGMISSILAGALDYGALNSQYPFKGYLIIFMILNALALLCSCFAFFMLSKKENDEEIFKVNVLHCFTTAGWFLFILLMFNRTGMLISMPLYVYLRTLYMTFPFYVYLLMPLFLAVIKVLNILGILSKKTSLILSIVALALNVVLFAVIVILAISDTAFISSVSAAMPLERIASKPFEIIIHFLSYTGVAVVLLLKSLKKEEPKQEQAQQE